MSSKKKIIAALAKRYADRKYGVCSGVHAMTKAIRRRAIVQYAENWLAQHGRLPEGVHVCTGRADWCSTPLKVEIDFTRLMHDPDYPCPHGPSPFIASPGKE
ncbi:hypothetical protein [Ensifer sp. MJa1]|uniref:hypothetical protein n=1 Tax=Ensifer sp. MJa1 TaxID=2919888 RepID=UPI003007F423